MRLRLRPGRPDIRQVFSDPGAPGTYTSHDTPKRMLSPARPRPKDPPPPPPPPSLDCAQQPLPELPPRQIFPFTKKQIEQMNNQARQFSIKAQNKQRKISSSSVSKGNITYDAETSVPPNIRPVSWSPLMESTLNDTFEYLNPVVKKKEHRHSDPGPIAPKIIVHIENSTTHLKESTESDMDKQEERNNSLPRMSSRNTDGKGSTIVTVSSSAPGSPLSDVHRLQITTEDVSLVPQRRTSILITNEETNPSTTSLQIQGDVSPVKQDSSNKVTICVGGGDTNLGSSCTIIDTSPSSSLTKSPKQKCSSLTVLSSSTSEVNVIPVSQEPVQRTLLVVDHHDNDSKVLQCWGDQQSNKNEIRVLNNTITIVDNKQDNVQEPVSSIVLTYKSRGTEVTNKEEDILLNPVEAVKRNLIPHVCGKRNETGDEVEMETSPDERLNKLIQMAAEADDSCTETMKEGDYCMAAAVSKLLDTSTEDSPPIYSNISSKSSEDTLPTVLEQDDEGDDDVFKTDSLSSAHADEEPTSINFDEEYEEDDDSRAVETSSSFPGDSSGCESAPSSIEPENEGTGEIENDSTATSHLHLSPSESSDLEKDNQEEVEIQEDKNESSTETRTETEDENVYESIKDPIYEEIPDTPPPLPLSPPPSLDDLDDSKRSSRSIFEGASKYDILSYLVGAKERGILPEELYYGGSTNGDEIIEIIDKPLRDEEGSGQNHQRMTSLDLTDLSSRVSHLSNASDSSEDSCNLIISNIGETPSSPNKVRKSSAEIERNDSGVGSETSKSSRSRWQHCGPACSIREDQQHLCEDCDQPVETQKVRQETRREERDNRRDCGDGGEVREGPADHNGRVLQPHAGGRASNPGAAGRHLPQRRGASGAQRRLGRETARQPRDRRRAGRRGPPHRQHRKALPGGCAHAARLRVLLRPTGSGVLVAGEPGEGKGVASNLSEGLADGKCRSQANEPQLFSHGKLTFCRIFYNEKDLRYKIKLYESFIIYLHIIIKFSTPHAMEELFYFRVGTIATTIVRQSSNCSGVKGAVTRVLFICKTCIPISRTQYMQHAIEKSEKLSVLATPRFDAIRILSVPFFVTLDNYVQQLSSVVSSFLASCQCTSTYTEVQQQIKLKLVPVQRVTKYPLLLARLHKDPLYLERCIVCSETDSEEYFEVQELASKDTFIFKAEDGERTRLWYRQLQYHAQGMGAWRRRRNALANIMINGMQTRN
ncbi:hypothetical protein C0J52_10964 [Blattella germanica]|nr:hypothetical protein C0J52_10964 [Blattella germanica]